MAGSDKGKSNRGKSNRGNSRRKNLSKSGKGNPTAGSGGRGRRRLAGRGPTPPAEDRPHHKAYRQPSQHAGAGGRAAPRPARAEWVAGRNAVTELLRAGVPVSELCVVEGYDARRGDPIDEAYRIAHERNVPVVESSRSDLDRLAGGAAHQGLVAKIQAFEYSDADELLQRAWDSAEPPLIVMLDGITDPRNLGAIVRSASGFGAHGVVIPQRRAAHMTAAAWKSSAGAAARMPIAQVTNMTRTLQSYQRSGLMAIGLTAGGDTSLDRCPVLDVPLAIVIGSEGKGVSRLVGQACDQLVSIPMSSDLESLNASVAASVALYATRIARSATPDIPGGS